MIAYGSGLKVVNETYEITIKDFNDVVKFIKQLKIDGLTILKVKRIFDIDKKETEIKLYQSALQDAKDKATKLLASVNKTVGDILLIDLYNNYNQPMIDDDSNYNNGYSNVESSKKKLIWATYAVTFQIK